MTDPKPVGLPLLDGIRVLELGSMYAAPTAGRMLRDFGASVVKVEDPATGDFARQWHPQKNGTAMGFARLNSGKRSIAIDLRHAAGRNLIQQLATTSDVVIENFRPGRLDSWGLGYDALSARNPGLVLVRVSGYGQDGPYRERPGFGTVAETISGFAHLNGWADKPPTSPPFGFADSIAGVAGAFGAAMALYRRQISGQGNVIDVALYEPLMFMLGDAILNFTSTGDIMTRRGNTSGSSSPRGIYEAKDGLWLSISASSQNIATRLFEAMGMPELKHDPRYRSNETRMANDNSLQELVQNWTASRTREEALTVLERFDVVAAAVNDARDIVSDAHFLSRTLVELSNTNLGSALMPGPILHVAGHTAPSYDGIPTIGEHTREVLVDELGLTEAELTELLDTHVISLASQ